MPRSQATDTSDVDLDAGHIADLERALTRIAHMLTRARRHDQTVAASGIIVDRANVPLLRMLAEADQPLRLGELACLLDVEAPHVTRQVQRLERTGFVTRVPDPGDRRAQRVHLTPAGHDAIDAIRAVGRGYMREALSAWTSEDLRLLATLNHRMVDDFLVHGERRQAFGQPTPQEQEAAARRVTE